MGSAPWVGPLGASADAMVVDGQENLNFDARPDCEAEIKFIEPRARSDSPSNSARTYGPK